MSQGIYSAAAGMAAFETRLDAVANDLANVNTDGYKRARLGFRDLVYAQQDANVRAGSGSAAVDAGRDWEQGTIHTDDNPLSLAIQGPGFFKLRRADGSTSLTRDGSFQVDANRHLVTSTGEQLDPPLTLPAGTSPADLTIAGDGAVTVKGTRIGAITLVDVPAPAGLQPIGDSQFAPSAASGAPVAATGATIQQHALEASNVDAADAMTTLIDTQRSYQLASRVISMQDQLMQIADDIRR
jgi:flagellar basal-body rod protein FlgG